MTKDLPVNIVLVGCGAVSQIIYANALRSLEGNGQIKVVGLVDPTDARRAEMLRHFPIASQYADLAACPVAPDHLVIVATPPKLHAQHSILALNKGAAVLCEKPMATSVLEANAMIDAARSSGALLAVGIFRRFFPAFEALKVIFETTPFGALKTFSVHEGGKFHWGAASDSFFRRDQTSGGVFFDIGVYVIDALLWWFGEPAMFRYEDDAMGGLEANCRLTLTYFDGVQGTVRLSRDWETQNRCVFVFERATVTYYSGEANRLALKIDGLPYAVYGELTDGGSARRSTRTNAQSFTEQIRNVVAAMRGQAELRVPGHEALRSLRFIEECYRSRTLMPMPWFSHEEAAVAERLARASL